MAFSFFSKAFDLNHSPHRPPLRSPPLGERHYARTMESHRVWSQIDFHPSDGGHSQLSDHWTLRPRLLSLRQCDTTRGVGRLTITIKAKLQPVCLTSFWVALPPVRTTARYIIALIALPAQTRRRCISCKVPSDLRDPLVTESCSCSWNIDRCSCLETVQPCCDSSWLSS